MSRTLDAMTESESSGVGTRGPGRRGRGVLVGAVALIVGPLQFLGWHLIAQSAWRRPYSWSRNTISDLGNVRCGPWGDDHRYVCSPLHAWMNTSIGLQGALLVLGMVLLRWARVGPFASGGVATLLVVSGLGYLTVAFVPADVNENVHLLAAVGVFLCGNGALVLAGLRSRTAVPAARGALLAGGLVGWGAAVMLFQLRYLGLGLGGMERVAVFPPLAVPVVAGLNLLTRRS